MAEAWRKEPPVGQRLGSALTLRMAETVRLLPLLLTLLLALPASADEVTYLLTGPDGRRSRLTVTDRPDGSVDVVREGGGTHRGPGQRVGDRVVARLEPVAETGLVRALQVGPQAGPAIDLDLRVAGGSAVASLRRGGSAREERGQAEPLPTARYALAPASALADGAGTIDLQAENAAVSARLRTLSPGERAVRWPIVVCPGFASEDQTTPISERSKARARHALKVMRDVGAHAIVVTGGNVHPAGTVHNEALELKRELLALGLTADRIAIDPAARHTTTNLRNAGRFVLAHGFDRALVVTSFGQSFYVGHGEVSTFRLRCKKELGHTIGRLVPVGLRRTRFSPTARVFERGPDPLDP